LKFEKEIPSPQRKKSRAILIRGGGLGDFILTLPLFDYIQSSYDEVLVLTKPSYFCLIKSKKITLELFELDLGISQICKQLKGSDVFTFWQDQDWLNELRNLHVQNIFILPAKPLVPPHIIESIFNALGLKSPDSFLSIPYLGDQWTESLTLWIHPGSGADNKNMPFSFYRKTAEDWLQKNKANHVIFSFGEADQSVSDSYECLNFINSERVQVVLPNSIDDYKNLLSSGVAEFWGNDSGPSHLAANLGIPTNVCFKSTNSAIWRPSGPRVRINEFSQEAN
jgi:ADP-heptose:LPS heptosyltransferase